MNVEISLALYFFLYYVITLGQFQLFRSSTDHVDTKEMVYKMDLTGDRGREYSFEGVKYIHKDHFGETGLKDTTTLFVKVYPRDKNEGEPLGRAILYITLSNFAKQLATIEITHTHSKREQLHWMSQFGVFFGKTLWDVYGPTSSCDKYFNPDATPRKKRPLKLNGCIPEMFNCITKDKVRYTRHNLLVCLRYSHTNQR